MRKKRRSTVYVRPGKDVTLYIPSETPPVVIEYLNKLKKEGVFSQGVMDIVTMYVLQEQQEQQLEPAIEDVLGPESFAGAEELIFEPEGQAESSDAEGQRPESWNPAGQEKFTLSQIFRQAGQNSGKLLKTYEEKEDIE